MNEIFFLIHSIIILCFLYGALFLGKEAVIVYVAACWLFANFFITKQILLFGYEVTASDVYAIGGMLGSSVIQEYWGKDVAKHTIKLTFILLLFAQAVSFAHISYFPSPNDVMHEHFAKILGPVPRLVSASLITFIVVQVLELSVFNWLKHFERVPFFIRAFCTIAFVQIVDTLLFSLLGLWGLVHSLFDVFIISYTMKLIIISLSTPCIAFSKYIRQKALA